VFFRGRRIQGRLSISKILGLDNLNNFSRLQAIEVVHSCPRPGPGVIWGRENTGLVCELEKVGSWDVDKGYVCL